MNKIEQIQELLGVKVDSIWGPKSQAALIEAPIGTKKDIQKLVGVQPDGEWGPISQGALNALTHESDDGWFACKASSFADPADLRSFKKCKLTGKTDVECFAVGDNGVGQFGKVTAQEDIPMIAVNAKTMKARWGSVLAAAHRPVMVTVKGKTIDATVEDRISAPGRIDLNPACAKLLGINPPFLVDCEWRWT